MRKEAFYGAAIGCVAVVVLIGSASVVLLPARLKVIVTNETDSELGPIKVRIRNEERTVHRLMPRGSEVLRFPRNASEATCGVSFEHGLAGMIVAEVYCDHSTGRITIRIVKRGDGVAVEFEEGY